MAETHAGTPSAWQRRLLGLGLIVAGLLLIATLVEVWPAATATGDDEHSVGLLFGIVDEAFTPDEALLLLIATAGGLGAAVNTATEFAYRVGDDRLDRSYLWWYPMRFLIAATLALIFYFVVRGGLLDPTTNASANLNVYVFAGLAGLAGMFSTQATRLLGAIFGSLPGAEETYSGPAPKVSALVPSDRDEKGDPGELVLRGHGFSEGARALVDGKPQQTRVIDDTRLGVRLEAGHRPGQRVSVVVQGAGGRGGQPDSSEATDVAIPDAG